MSENESGHPQPQFTKNPHGHEQTLGKLMDRGATEDEARSRVAKTLKDPVARELVRAGRESSLRDPLTGLPNRRYLFGDESLPSNQREGALYRMFAEAQRSGHGLSVLFIDGDNFGVVNKEHGHSVGDEVLKTLGRTLRGSLRESDLLARYGGEEFVALLPESHNLTPEEISGMVERIRQNVEASEFPRGIRQTVSIGVVSYAGEQGMSADELMSRANDAEQLAKNSGRNRFETWTPQTPKRES